MTCSILHTSDRESKQKQSLLDKALWWLASILPKHRHLDALREPDGPSLIAR